MTRRGGLLVVVLVTALAVVGIVWLLLGESEGAAPASIVAPPAAAEPRAIVADGAVAAPIQPLPTEMVSTAVTSAAVDASASPGVGEARCRVVTAKDRTPLADVTVEVVGRAKDPVLRKPEPEHARAVTGVDGVASITFPRAFEVWQVRALPGPGHALYELNSDDSDDKVIVIEPGHVESLELPVKRGATIRGTVVDDRNNLVAHALVSAWSTFRANVYTSEGLREPDSWLWTDASGGYVAEGIGPSFVLMARTPGMAAVRGFQGELREDEERDDVQLVVGRATEIRGRVLDPEYRPIASVWVQASNGRSEWGSGVATEAGPLGASALTDRDGRFLLTPLAQQQWQLSVWDPRNGHWSGSQTPDGTEVQIVFAGGCRVAGIVRGPDGAPLSNAELKLRGASISREDGLGPTGEARWHSDADGRFVFRGLVPSGQAAIGVVAAGCAVKVVSPLVVSAEGSGDLDVRLEKERVIAGQVENDKGEPLAGAVVWVSGDRLVGTPSGPMETWEQFAGKSDTLTGADGRFRLDGLYDGEFQLTAKDPRREALRKSVPVPAGKEDLVVRLDAADVHGAVLRGNVRDGITGAPIQDFSVWLSTTSFAPVFGGGGEFHDPLGAYRVEDIAPGDWKIHLDAPGYVPTVSEPMTLDGGEHQEDLTLLPERTLRLRVVDQDRAPVRAWVNFQDAQGNYLQELANNPPKGAGTIGSTDENGEVTVQGLRAAPVVLLLRVDVVPGLQVGSSTYTFDFDLRQEPVDVQERKVTRDKRRKLVLSLYQQQPSQAGAPATAGQAFEPTGLDPNDKAASETFNAHDLNGSLAPPTVAVTARLRANDGTVREIATCTPAGDKSFTLASAVFAGPSPMAVLLLALPQKDAQLDVSADGCATESLSLPAGDDNVLRSVVLRAAK